MDKVNNNDFMEEELIFNSETNDYEVTLVDKRTKKEFKDSQIELNKNLDSNFYFPYKQDNLEEKKILKTTLLSIDLTKPEGVDDLPLPEQKLYNDYLKRKNFAANDLLTKRGGGRSVKLLSEKEIRYSMENSNNVASAALFLAVPRPRWLKYAKTYFDIETGKSLYQLHNIKCWGVEDPGRYRREGGFSDGSLRRNKKLYNSLYGRLIDPVTGEYVLKEHRKIVILRNRKIKLLDVVNGLHPNYDPVKLKRNLIKAGWLVPKCEKCGWEESRQSDGKSAIVLNFKDNNVNGTPI